jgi:hypothetical protein
LLTSSTRARFASSASRSIGAAWRGCLTRRQRDLSGQEATPERAEAGRNPYGRGLTDLVGELSTRSEEFRTWWASHNVRIHRTSTKQMHHPVVGPLELTGEALQLPGDTGLTIITYTVDPATPSAEAVQFLSNWSNEDVPASSFETN